MSGSAATAVFDRALVLVVGVNVTMMLSSAVAAAVLVVAILDSLSLSLGGGMESAAEVLLLPRTTVAAKRVERDDIDLILILMFFMITRLHAPSN